MDKESEKQLNIDGLGSLAILPMAGIFVVKILYPEQILFYLEIILPLLFVAIALFWVYRANFLNALCTLTLAAVIISCSSNSSLHFIFGVVAIFLIIITLLYELHLANKTK